jgi:hypothetical protein
MPHWLIYLILAALAVIGSALRYWALTPVVELPEPGSTATRLAQPKKTLVVGIVGLLMFGLCALDSYLNRGRRADWDKVAIFGAFSLFSLLCVADYFIARHEVSDTGLRYRRITGQSGYVHWSDVRWVSYAQSLRWFRLVTHTGEVVHISAFVTALPAFAKHLLAHISKQDIDPKALIILERAAVGNVAALWR